MWSKEYVDYVDRNFDKLFKEIYEETFIDSIFSQNDAFVSRDDFVDAITTNSNDMPAAEWVFKTSALSQKFQENIPLREIEKELYQKQLESGVGEVSNNGTTPFLIQEN